MLFNSLNQLLNSSIKSKQLTTNNIMVESKLSYKNNQISDTNKYYNSIFTRPMYNL
ncbi:hypothetical protein DDB_G0275229 [Dictyostelium discoideum AX4]|uniref:Uncharacterized protein n=1 Tax=Dictyostelium discoideum TaxID=44689 RepID=Q554K1_DICDI|nr:hypothetical protein DDB_G0275229 [Dictyostelium discoideum AX4]EAL69895.1 hypothetical protein DDB_G0275229 [Dictyostelium discoideum AX4]|eukprot:XP_643710.1 hypothetical protein DDB_G0275229 [Dictyostelium discoideum AX4]